MLNYFKATVPAFLLCLSACGSGTGAPARVGSNFAPTAATGYAQSGDKVQRGVTLNIKNAKFIAFERGSSEQTLVAKDFVHKISDDGSEVDLTIDGETATLSNGGTGRRYDGAIGGKTFSVIRIGNLDGADGVVEGVFVFVSDSSSFVGGYQILGFNTNPSDVPVTGTATYRGNAAMATRHAGNDGFADGTAQLDVNFAANTVSGNIALKDANDSNAEIVLPTIDITFSDTPLGGNGFEVNPTVTLGPLAGADAPVIAINSTDLAGQFFGNTGQAAAGQIQSTGTVDGVPLVANGVFVTLQ